MKGSKYPCGLFHCNETGNIEYAVYRASIDDSPQNGDYGEVELLNNGSALGVYGTPVSYLPCAVNPMTCAFTSRVVLKHYQPGETVVWDKLYYSQLSIGNGTGQEPGAYVALPARAGWLGTIYAITRSECV